MPIFYKNSACNGQTRLVGEVDFLTGAMPLLREEKIHGWPCKFYDNGVVMVGTTADRFSIKLLADEGAWFATKLRAELVARELATAEELPIDEAGEAAMATKEAAKARARAMKAALNITIKAEAVHARAAAALARAELDVEFAPLKRDLAEKEFKIAQKEAKVAKLAPVLAQAAEHMPKAASLQTKLESFFRRPIG